MQALRADVATKAGMLERLAEAKQCLQAEADRLKQACGAEQNRAKVLQDDEASWRSKARANQEVGVLQILLSSEAPTPSQPVLAFQAKFIPTRSHLKTSYYSRVCSLAADSMSCCALVRSCMSNLWLSPKTLRRS